MTRTKSAGLREGVLENCGTKKFNINMYLIDIGTMLIAYSLFIYYS